MPTYSYRCRDCSTAFDIQQAFTDDSLTVCPTCGGSLRKVFNAVGVSFNGSGFYRNDSRAAAASATAKSEKKESSAPASSASSSSQASSAPSSTPSAPAPTKKEK